MTITIQLSLAELILIRDALYEIPSQCQFHFRTQDSDDKDANETEVMDDGEFFYMLNNTEYPEQEIDMLAQKIDDLSAPYIDVP